MVRQEVPESGPQVALLTPYTGGNLGDAAIQDAMIANLCRRMPGARKSLVAMVAQSPHLHFREPHGVVLETFREHGLLVEGPRQI